MTIIANLLVCALVLMALAALWVLARVWLGSPKLVRGDDPCADTKQDPVRIDSDRVKWYPPKCTQCQGDPDGCMNCR